jgi:hypothetical protein
MPVLVAGLEMKLCVHAWTSSHALCANEHCKQIWCANSGAALHNGHKGLQGQLLSCNLSAVRIFSCSNSQVKNRCLGSACADQIQLGLKVQRDPLNWTSYADLAVYWPSAVCRELPSDSILLFIELHILHRVPKYDELRHLLN